MQPTFDFVYENDIALYAARTTLRTLPVILSRRVAREEQLTVSRPSVALIAFHFTLQLAVVAVFQQNNLFSSSKKVLIKNNVDYAGVRFTSYAATAASGSQHTAMKNLLSIRREFASDTQPTLKHSLNRSATRISLNRIATISPEARQGLQVDIDELSKLVPTLENNFAINEALFRSPLFSRQQNVPDDNHRLDEGLKHQKIWSFWYEWYQGFLDGTPVDWELQRRVALISDTDLEKGPEHIATLIEEIKAAYLAEKLPLAEDLAFDHNTSTFHTVPREMAKPDLLGATLSQVEDALEDAMTDGSNGINENSTEFRKLSRTFRKYGNDPQRIEMDFTTVHAGLTRQIISGELPPCEDNLALQSALEEGAKAVRATHPEVAENRRILQEQSLRELSQDEKDTLEEALPVLQAISDEALAEEWGQDIPALVNDALGPVPTSAPRLPGADEATRIFGRAARMAVLLQKSSDLIHKIDGSAGYKAARIATTISALVGLGIAAFSIM